jgi:uncharacterized protein (TIGR02996 family)
VYGSTSYVSLNKIIDARGQKNSTAIDLALVEWTKTRNPIVAEVVQLLSNEALELTSVATHRDIKTFHEAWLQMDGEHDVMARGFLAKTLTEKLPIEAEYFGILRDDYTQTKYAGFFERIEKVKKWPADPRVASALCQIFEEAEFLVYDAQRTRPVYEPLVELLVAQGDVRSLARMEQLKRNPKAKRAVLRTLIGELVSSLIPNLKLLSFKEIENESEWKLLLPMAQGNSRNESNEAALLEAIYSNATDDSARLIYADALTERGDEQGEFISLQLVRNPTEKQIKRANSLLKKHRAQWLGPLENTLTKTKFERGFLVSAHLAQNASATDEVWAISAKNSRLGTLEFLFQGRGSGEHMAQFYSGGALRNLKRCELLSYNSMEVLANKPLSKSIEHLVLPKRGNSKRLKALAQFDLSELKTLTGFLRVENAAQWLNDFQSSGLPKTIQRLNVGLDGYQFEGFNTAVISFWDSLQVPALAAVNSQEGDMFLLSRKNGQVTLKTDAYFSNELLSWLKAIHSKIDFLEVQNPGAQEIRDRQQIDAAAEARGIEVKWQS